MIPSTLVKRIVFGALMIALLAGLIALDAWVSDPSRLVEREGLAPILHGLPVLAILWLLTAGGFLELAKMARSAGVRVHLVAGLLSVLAIVALPKLPPYLAEPFITPLSVMALSVLAVFLSQMLTGRTEDALGRIGATMLGVFYLGLGGATILALRLFWGLETLIVFLAAVKLTDVGAYFVGSLLGRHKLVPFLSPGKSWEGLGGGLATAALVGWLAPLLIGCDGLEGYPLAVGPSILFCVILGLVGQFGDLCESLLKRSAGVKDAGRLVPQFGGVLDLIDSPLLAAPVAHLLLIAMA